jgi:hypothetical protein
MTAGPAASCAALLVCGLLSCAAAPLLKVYASHTYTGGCGLQHRGRPITTEELAALARTRTKPSRVVIGTITNIPDQCMSGPAAELRRLGIRVIVEPLYVPKNNPWAGRE